MAMEMQRLSREFVWWPTNSHTSDLDQAVGEVAFLAAGEQPEESDWYTADILPAEDGLAHDWWLRILVGPGGTVALDPGDWQAWTRIEANPERPVYKAGIVTIL